MSSSFADRDADEANGEAENAGHGRCLACTARFHGDTNLLSLCIWNRQSEIPCSFKHIHVPRSSVHTCCFWRKFIFTVYLKVPIWDIIFISSLCIVLGAICPHFMILTQFYYHCIFEIPNLKYYFYLSICMSLRAMCSHIVLLAQLYTPCAFQIPI